MCIVLPHYLPHFWPHDWQPGRDYSHHDYDRDHYRERAARGFDRSMFDSFRRLLVEVATLRERVASLEAENLRLKEAQKCES